MIQKLYVSVCDCVCVCYQVCFFVRKRLQAICADARLSVLNGAHVLGSQNDVSKAPSNLDQLHVIHMEPWDILGPSHHRS